MALKPTATLYVQKGEADANGEADALLIPFPDSAAPEAPFAQATVSHSTAKEGVSTDCTITLSGIKYSEITQFKGGGFVRVEAGYLGNEDAPPQTVFFGKYKDTYYRVDDGKKLWTMVVDAQPFEIAAVPVRFSEKNILVGDAIQKVFNTLGIIGAITPLAFGDETDLPRLPVPSGTTPISLRAAATIPEWNPQGRPAFAALNDLVLYLRAAIQDQFGVNRRIALVPDTTQGFTYNILDLDSSEPFRVLDIDASEGLVLGGGPEPIDEPVNPGVDQGPTSEGTEDGAEVALDPGTAVVASRRRFTLVTVFDPRITIATVINVIDKETGETPFIVTDVRHQLSGGVDGWRTECEGDVLGGVFALA